MMKIFDYYYLVLLRYIDCIYGKDKLSYYVPGIAGFTLTVNLFSFAIIINRHIIDNGYFWIIIGIVGVLIIIALDTIYNKKRRDRVREQYRNESRESRQRGVVMVVLYEILSVAFLIFIVVMFVKPHP